MCNYFTCFRIKQKFCGPFGKNKTPDSREKDISAVVYITEA